MPWNCSLTCHLSGTLGLACLQLTVCISSQVYHVRVTLSLQLKIGEMLNYLNYDTVISKTSKDCSPPFQFMLSSLLWHIMGLLLLIIIITIIVITTIEKQRHAYTLVTGMVSV